MMSELVRNQALYEIKEEKFREAVEAEKARIKRRHWFIRKFLPFLKCKQR